MTGVLAQHVAARKAAPVNLLNTIDAQDGFRFPTTEERNALLALRPLSAWDERHIDLTAQYHASVEEFDHAIDIDDSYAESHWRGVMDTLNAEIDEWEDAWEAA